MTVLPKTVSDAMGASYAKFNDAYELAGTPAVILANAENRVVYAGVVRSKDAEKELRALEEAIAKAL